MFMEVHSSARSLCSSWALSLCIVSMQCLADFLQKFLYHSGISFLEEEGFEASCMGYWWSSACPVWLVPCVVWPSFPQMCIHDGNVTATFLVSYGTRILSLSVNPLFQAVSWRDSIWRKRWCWLCALRFLRTLYCVFCSAALPWLLKCFAQVRVWAEKGSFGFFPNPKYLPVDFNFQCFKQVFRQTYEESSVGRYTKLVWDSCNSRLLSVIDLVRRSAALHLGVLWLVDLCWTVKERERPMVHSSKGPVRK